MPFLLKRIQGGQRKLYSSLHQKHDTYSLVYCPVCHMPLLRMWNVIKILEKSCKPYSYCTILNLCPHSWTPDHNRTKDLSTYSLCVCNTTVFLLMNLEVALSTALCISVGIQGAGMDVSLCSVAGVWYNFSCYLASRCWTSAEDSIRRRHGLSQHL